MRSQSPTAKGLSRRELIRTGALGMAGLAASKFAFAQTFRGSAQGALPPADFLAPTPQSKYGLVSRVTFGVNTYEMGLFDQLGWKGYLEYQLAPSKINDSALQSRLLEFPTINATPYQNVTQLGYNQGFDIYSDLAGSQILRAALSRRQLLEVMTEFWLDHFNIYSDKIWHEFLPTYLRTVRQYALSDFHTLLTAVVKSGAMLFYLDNIVNESAFHNENFARELLELHTLGVDSGYWEADIYVARRCFTGWNFEGYYNWPWQNTTDPKWGQFMFYSEHHDNEGGYFLGTTPSDYISKGGIEQGETILQKLAAHPSTAHHIARKLCVKFLGEGVSESFIQSTANVFLTSKGDIPTILRYILDQTNFTANVQPKFKRPFHYTISGMRATYASILDTSDVLWWVLQPMRQQPFHWAPPNGYPDAYAVWVDNLLPRWRFGTGLAQNTYWGVRTDIFSYMTGRTPKDVAAYINRYLFAGALDPTRLASLTAYMRPANPTNQQIRETVGLALCSPDFMWY